jgi:rhodanese-related sulfurtransferase
MEELVEYINNKKDIQLIDVRALSELKEKGKLPNAIHIDLHELRIKLNELDKNKETIVYCARGLRGYVASRILTHNGFKNVKNLSGGFTIWQMHNHKSMIYQH